MKKNEQKALETIAKVEQEMIAKVEQDKIGKFEQEKIKMDKHMTEVTKKF